MSARSRVLHRFVAWHLFLLAMLVSSSAAGVRVNPDGHGQALIYPYYTARSNAQGAFVTALSLTNTTTRLKAVKVRIREARAGAEVFSLNVFLDVNDVWTAGIVSTGGGAGIVSADRSCTTPAVATVVPFSSAQYQGDLLGDSVDRTGEGWIEVFEMATIDPVSPLGRSMTHVPSLSVPNASKPSCIDVPIADAPPVGVLKPTGGLVGTVSYLNINQGVDFSVDAVALTGWTDRIQWSGPANPVPNLSTATPAVSVAIEQREDRDTLYLTKWERGIDAVTAALMTHRLVNDYTVEPDIRAGTDWVMTMPTKPYHASRAVAGPPYQPRSTPSASSLWSCEKIVSYPDRAPYCNREAACASPYGFGENLSGKGTEICGAAVVTAFGLNGETFTRSVALNGAEPSGVPLMAPFTNGWMALPTDLHKDDMAPAVATGTLAAVRGATTAIDLTSGQMRTSISATYLGLPVIGFSAQFFSTTGLPGVSTNVLSNYGGQSRHKTVKSLYIAP